jgi:hypothetical protein
VSSTQTFTVDKFLGLNEAADGKTELKMGQAARMENFLVTDSYNLSTRPGIQRIDFENQRSNAPVLGVWAGNIGGTEYLTVVDVLDGADRIWMFAKKKTGGFTLTLRQDGALGLTMAEGAKVKIFAFAGTLYVMSAKNTVIYRGGEFAEAEVYVPLVVTGADPAGGGTELEGINLLSTLRRIDYSADGEAKAFALPAEAAGVTQILIDNISYAVETAGAFDPATHTFTFNSAPEKGVGNVELTYDTDPEQGEKNRMRVVNMTLTESYNGATDTRLFLAGDGSNLCIYSGVPQSGDITKLYFPAMNEVAVDMAAGSVTGLVRSDNKLLVFTKSGADLITYEPVTLAGGRVIAGFYLRAANREFGNEAMGQVQVVQNKPRSVTSGGIYEWNFGSYYTRDERHAKRVSDMVGKTLRSADTDRIVTCDDNVGKTYYVFLNDESGTVLVNRYALDGEIWCVYRSGLCTDVRWAKAVGGIMTFSTGSDLFYFNSGTTKDAPAIPGGESQTINAVWESGYMDFGADFRRKYSSLIYLSILPEASSSLTVTASTDRRETYVEKMLNNTLFSFANVDFARWSFSMNATPKIRRVRLKVKKFVYYKLIFKVEQPGTRATVLSFDQQVRYASMVK